MIYATTPCRIIKLDRLGRFLFAFGSQGSNPGQFLDPTGIALDKQGHIFVTDAGKCRVQVFTPSGHLIRTFGEKGKGNGQLSGPSQIAIDSLGTIYIYDESKQWEDSRIEKFDTSGRFLGLLKLPIDQGRLFVPAGIVVDARDNVYVPGSTPRRTLSSNENTNGGIKIFSRQGKLLSQFKVNPAWSFRNIRVECLAVDTQGTLYIGEGLRRERPTGRVLRFRLVRPLSGQSR